MGLWGDAMTDGSGERGLNLYRVDYIITAYVLASDADQAGIHAGAILQKEARRGPKVTAEDVEISEVSADADSLDENHDAYPYRVTPAHPDGVSREIGQSVGEWLAHRAAVLRQERLSAGLSLRSSQDGNTIGP